MGVSAHRGDRRLSEILERHVKKAILDYCAAYRIFVQVRNVGAVKTGTRFIRFNKSGMADLWGIGWNGRHWECELKRPGASPTASQEEWLARCRSLGAIAFWVDSVEMFADKIKEAL